MDASVAIEVNALGKKFCPALRRSLVYAALDIARDVFPVTEHREILRPGEFWALRNVNFAVRRGEALALIGHNGAGKSTLLKILYGLLQANTGSIRIEGKVVALIELGAGINPLLTGRENIVLVAQLNRLSRGAAKALVPDVLEFAELQHVADVAVQTYSSGMRARLSYAIAAMLRPDVLLVDEVLAVGDLAFQRKCVTHMQRFIAQGGTLVLVSHAPHHVQLICSHAILLEHGEVVAQGDPAQVVRRYLEMRPVDTPPIAGASTSATAAFRIDELTLMHREGRTARSGEDATLRIRYEAHEPLAAFFGVAIFTQDGWTCITTTFDLTGRPIAMGRGTLECSITRLPLVAGCYIARPIIADASTLTRIPLAGAAHAGTTFEVIGAADLLSNGQMQMAQLITVDSEWNVETETASDDTRIEAS